MQILNAAKSREYFDSLVDDELEDSAVSVIHASWLEHKAPNGRLEHLEPVSFSQNVRAAASTWTRQEGTRK